MSNDKGHGYGWDDVRSRPADELTVGDTWVAPGTRTGYSVAPDGRVHGASRAHAMPLDGTAWTLTARDGERLTARSHTGVEMVRPAPAGRRVLVVTKEARNEE